MSYQHLTIVGRLGRDPEMRTAPNGQAVTNFSVATDRQYTDGNGQRVKETTWFSVSVWGKQAESANQYLRKGSMVLVDGRLTCDSKTGGPRVWKKQDSIEGASFEVNASTVRFLSGKGDTGEQYEQPASASDEEISF